MLVRPDRHPFFIYVSASARNGVNLESLNFLSVGLRKGPYAGLPYGLLTQDLSRWNGDFLIIFNWDKGRWDLSVSADFGRSFTRMCLLLSQIWISFPDVCVCPHPRWPKVRTICHFQNHLKYLFSNKISPYHLLKSSVLKSEALIPRTDFFLIHLMP